MVAKTAIDPAIPLRLIGVESHSGYSTVSRGYWPFGFTGGVIDRLRADAVRERRPTLEYLPMNAPEAADQIVSGVFDLEGKSRWISGSAAIALKNPTEPMPLRAEFYIPPNAPARRVSLLLDGKEVATRTYPGPGSWSLESKPVKGESEFAMAEIAVDKTFQAPGDTRDLGVVLIGVGFGEGSWANEGLGSAAIWDCVACHRNALCAADNGRRLPPYGPAACSTTSCVRLARIASLAKSLKVFERRFPATRPRMDMIRLEGDSEFSRRASPTSAACEVVTLENPKAKSVRGLPWGALL